MTDPAYDEEVPDRWRRCLLCGLEVEEHEWDTHWAECDIQPWEWV
jgi:hypothetical protein